MQARHYTNMTTVDNHKEWTFDETSDISQFDYIYFAVPYIYSVSGVPTNNIIANAWIIDIVGSGDKSIKFGAYTNAYQCVVTVIIFGYINAVP